MAGPKCDPSVAQDLQGGDECIRVKIFPTSQKPDSPFPVILSDSDDDVATGINRGNGGMKTLALGL